MLTSRRISSLSSILSTMRLSEYVLVSGKTTYSNPSAAPSHPRINWPTFRLPDWPFFRLPFPLHPQPPVISSVCPKGCVCHAVRDPGSKVTLAPTVRAGARGWKSGSIRTVPVNHSADPLADGCVPMRVIFIFDSYVVVEKSSDVVFDDREVDRIHSVVPSRLTSCFSHNRCFTKHFAS